MARQNISTGSAANDGTGDTLRQAAQKINETLLDIYTHFGDSNNLSQVVSIVGDTLQFNRGNTYRITAIDNPSANRTITLPDASGVITLNEATQTLTNKKLAAATLVSPIVSGTINDSNGNPFIKFTPISNGVNGITVNNATTGNPPTISPNGPDTNINLSLIGKNAGSVQLGKIAYSSVVVTADGTVSAAASYILCNRPGGPLATLTLSLDSGSTIGEFKIFTNKGVGTATVTPTAFAQGTSFQVPTNAGAQLIWDGSNWVMLGIDSDIAII